MGGLESGMIRLHVSDGRHEDVAYLTLNVLRPPPKVQLLAGGPYDLRVGGSVSGTIGIHSMGPRPLPDDLALVQLTAFDDFIVSETGRFAFVPAWTGTYHVRVGIDDTEGIWPPGEAPQALLVFNVQPANRYPPMAYGWKEVRVVEGTTARVQLQALDDLGEPVTFAVVDGDGLGATVDASTGVLELRPADGQLGRYTVELSLSDGELDEVVILEVYITEEPSLSGLWVVLAVTVAGLVIGGIYYWSLRRGRLPWAAEPEPASPEANPKHNDRASG
jgi:hypothetical protein